MSLALRALGGTCRSSGEIFRRVSQRLMSRLLARILSTVSGNHVPLMLFDTLKNFFIGEQLIYNAVLVLGVQQNESIIHIHISTLLKILFPYRSLQSAE